MYDMEIGTRTDDVLHKTLFFIRQCHLSLRVQLWKYRNGMAATILGPKSPAFRQAIVTRCTVDHRSRTSIRPPTKPSSKEWKSVPEIWKSTAEKHGDQVALVDPHHSPPSQMTYNEVEQSILDFAEGLKLLGVTPDERVALFADNSCRWLIADQGIMATGAANAVRGSRSSTDELIYIYNHSDSIALVVDSHDLLKQLIPGFQKTSSSLRFIILLWGLKQPLDDLAGVPVFTYKECVTAGRRFRSHRNEDDLSNLIQPDDLATIVYTSGTTGKPKGVMLTHANLLHQVEHLIQCIQPLPGDRFLSLLPPWHMYERASEYFIFTRGIEQVYTNVKSLKDDLKQFPAQYFVSVPLVYDTLYSEVQKKLKRAPPLRKALVMAFLWISSQYLDFRRYHQGRSLHHARQLPDAPHISAAKWLAAWVIANFLLPLHLLGKKLVLDKIKAAIGIEKSGISGGGSLPLHVDRFYEIVGITLLNGYGLTETSPVISTRVLPDNILGTIGRPLKETEVKIVDPTTKKRVKDGERGLVIVRGPQVMKGYHKNPAAALDSEGWFNTGDLGWIVPSRNTGPSRRCGGMIVLEGREKDTIVLLTGENVEPAEIEEAALQSPLIEQIMVVGQDQRRLGALIVPSKEAAQTSSNADSLRLRIRDELSRCTKGCAFSIGPFHVLPAGESFTVDNGSLTPTMKLKRNEIVVKYRAEFDSLFDSN